MKLINFTLLLFFAAYYFTLRPDIKNSRTYIEYRPVQDTPSEKAFGILRNKCNTCHATKKRAEIFTELNMDSLAPDIYEQVFIKKKMPKGRMVELTEKELQNLKIWINTIPDANEPPKNKKSR